MTRVRFTDEGCLVIDHGPMREEWREAICPECGDQIQWILDMASFTNRGDGTSALTHAWCAWKPEGFDSAKRKAKEVTRRAEHALANRTGVT